MRVHRIALVSVLLMAACGTDRQPEPTFVLPSAGASGSSAAPSSAPSGVPKASKKVAAKPTPTKKAVSRTLPEPGNSGGGAGVPGGAQQVDTSNPDRTVGNGSPGGCTSAAVVSAVAAGGVITFNCGPTPVTITMAATAKVRNSRSTVVLDGGGKVTLSGGGSRRILYMNTCDEAQGLTTDHCQNQDTPRLTLQNLVFANGNSTGQKQEGGGGGAVFARGGHLKVVNSRFTGNRCDTTGPDLGGAALRVLEQGGGQPVYVVGSTFTGGQCSNGGGLSSIGVSWMVLNSVFESNKAIGYGQNPALAGTPGGGSGGAMYFDGNTFTVTVSGTVIRNNNAREGGGAIFYVSNDKTGTLNTRGSTLTGNVSQGFQNHPGIFFLGKSILQ